MSETPWSAAAQRVRRDELFALIRDRFRPLLDDNARSKRLIWWDQPRVALWAANAFYAGDAGAVDFADRIVRYVREDLNTEPGPRPFEASGIAGLLAHWEDRMAADVRTWLLDFWSQLLPHGCTRDFTFHGYNDNMPVMWTWALCFGGQRLDNTRFREVGQANLCQLRDMLRRRGTVSEYGQGYATHRLTGIAQVGAVIDDADVSGLARDLEARLWAELAGHWHPALAEICGGSMRGGTPVSTETPHLLRQVFGDDILPTPETWKDLYAGGRGFITEMGLDPEEYLFAYPYGYGAEFSAAEYHVPEQIAALFYTKPLPYTFRCSAEVGHTNEGVFCPVEQLKGHGGASVGIRLSSDVVEIPHYPASGCQPHHLVTHHGRHFALGTATLNKFMTSHALRCNYRRADGSDGCVLVRYNINGKVPCGRHENTYWKSPEYSETQGNYCTLYRDMGTQHCLQDGATAICLSEPRYLEHWQIRNLATDIFLWDPDRRITNIDVGDERVDAFPWEGEAATVCVDEGAVHLGIVPLIGRHAERSAAMRIRRTEQYLVLSLINYEGGETAMSKREMMRYGGGFVLDVRDAEDCESYTAFRAAMAATRVIDRFYHAARTVHYARPDLQLGLRICPAEETVMFATVNGCLRPTPQLDLNGANLDLPFLGGPSAPGFADWDWLETQHSRPVESYNPQD